MTNSRRPFPCSIDGDNVPCLPGVCGDKQPLIHIRHDPPRRDGDVVPGGCDNQQRPFPIGRRQLRRWCGAARCGKFDIGPRSPAVVGVGESDVTAVGGGADPDPARARLVDRQRRRASSGTLNGLIVQSRRSTTRGRNRSAAGVERDGVRGGKQRQHLLGRVQRGRLVLPRQRRRVARSPSRSAMPVVPTADPATTTAKRPRTIGRRAPKGRGRQLSPTGRSAPRDCPPSRSRRPNRHPALP